MVLLSPPFPSHISLPWTASLIPTSIPYSFDRRCIFNFALLPACVKTDVMDPVCVSMGDTLWVLWQQQGEGWQHQIAAVEKSPSWAQEMLHRMLLGQGGSRVARGCWLVYETSGQRASLARGATDWERGHAWDGGWHVGVHEWPPASFFSRRAHLMHLNSLLTPTNSKQSPKKATAICWPEFRVHLLHDTLKAPVLSISGIKDFPFCFCSSKMVIQHGVLPQTWIRAKV